MLGKKQREKRVEKQVFLLCTEGILENIMETLCAQFGIRDEGAGNTLSLHNQDIEIQIMTVTAELGEEAGKFLKEQKQGAWAHFLQVPTAGGKETDKKINVLHQIRKTQGFCSVKYSYLEENGAEKEQQIFGMLTGVLEPLRGLLLQAGQGEDCLFSAAGKLVLSDQGRSQVDSFMPYIDRALIEAPKEGISEEQMMRRAKSRAVLDQKEIYVTEWYPYIEKLSDAKIRTGEEIAGRMMALLSVALYSECLLGEGMSVEEAREFVREKVLTPFGVEPFLSPAERSYLDNPKPDEQEMTAFSWQYENLYVMEWALGLIEELDFPDHICDVPLVVRTVRQFEDRKELLEAAKPRSGAELLDACDLIFCLDWACVDARIYGLSAPAGMDGGVTMERHKSLNWLVGSEGADWDDVQTNT